MAKKKTSLVDAARRLSRDAEPSASVPTSKPAATSKPTASPKAAPAASKSTAKSPARKAPTKPADPAPRAKSSVPATRPSNAGDAGDRATTIAEIVEIAEGLDDPGLALLLKQAQVVRYKGQIEEFNRQLNSAAGRAAQARRDANRPDYVVDIERNEDDFFIIKMDSARVFFNRGELRELTRICHKASNARAGAKRLFRWFEEERSDLLADAGINSDSNPYLTELYELIVSTYKVKS